MAARLTPAPTSLYVITKRDYAKAGNTADPVAVCPAGTSLADARREVRRLDRYAPAGVFHHVDRVPVRVPRV